MGKSISVRGDTFAIIKAHCEKERITHGEFVESLLPSPERTLDTIARERTAEVDAPWCASCTEVRPPYMLVDGRAMCGVCREEHPRQGRYSFEGGRPDPRGQGANASVIGEGNRSTHGKGRRVR